MSIIKQRFVKTLNQKQSSKLNTTISNIKSYYLNFLIFRPFSKNILI